MSGTINEDMIINRHSVRTFQAKNISVDHQQALIAFIDRLTNPWNITLNIALLNDLKISTDKIKTYGMIKNPAVFLAAWVDDQPFALEAIGYTLEHAILFAESIGISSCWLGATFNKSSVQKRLNIKSQQILPVIIAMGYAQENLTLKDKIIKKAISSYNRLPNEQLFFDNAPKMPLSLARCGQYQKCLEMVRLAPSAFNAQPWRIIKTNNSFDFYIYSSKELRSSSLKHVDMGIALAHFMIMVKNLNLAGYLDTNPKHAANAYDHYHLIASWQLN